MYSMALLGVCFVEYAVSARIVVRLLSARFGFGDDLIHFLYTGHNFLKSGAKLHFFSHIGGIGLKIHYFTSSTSAGCSTYVIHYLSLG